MELLGLGERTRRWCRRYEEEEGEAGLLDRRIGKASGCWVPVIDEDIEHLYRTRYQGHRAALPRTSAHDHRFAWSYSWTKAFPQAELLPKAARRGAHRRKRPRRPLPGRTCCTQDTAARVAGWRSPSIWWVRRHATSDIYSALLVEEEGTASTFRALLEVLGRHGLPLSLYTDRGSQYFHAAEAGGRVDRGQPTQIGARWHIWASSTSRGLPQARAGRSDCFTPAGSPAEGTGADRHHDDGRSQRLAARDIYMAHNARFATTAEQEAAFVAVPGLDLAEVLCVEEERVVGNDNCVSFLNRNQGYRKACCVRTSSATAGASTPRRWPRCFPWPPLPRRYGWPAKVSRSANSCAEPRRVKDAGPSRRQARAVLAPGRPGNVPTVSPGNGRRRHRPKHKTRTSYMMCHIDRPT